MTTLHLVCRVAGYLGIALLGSLAALQPRAEAAGCGSTLLVSMCACPEEDEGKYTLYFSGYDGTKAVKVVASTSASGKAAATSTPKSGSSAFGHLSGVSGTETATVTASSQSGGVWCSPAVAATDSGKTAAEVEPCPWCDL